VILRALISSGKNSAAITAKGWLKMKRYFRVAILEW
jgi:hypothetical protein